MTKRRDIHDICREVVARTGGSDGTDNVRVIVQEALHHNPRVTVAQIARLVIQARTDWASEQKNERGKP